MAVTSKQESILANIVTTLKTINATGNYNLNFGSNVWRTLRMLDELSDSEVPGACILDEDDVILTPGTNNEYTTGEGGTSDVKNGWPILIIAYVKTSTQDIAFEGLLQKELIKAYSDVTVAMLADITRGGYAISTTLIGVSKRIDRKSGRGAVGLTFMIKYDFSPNAGTPTT